MINPSNQPNGDADVNGDGDFWIFGYGSLIWKPIPDLNGKPSYDARIPGHVLNYVRRFWQASHDHRGTPTSPGRVVTLISHADWRDLQQHDGSRAEVEEEEEDPPADGEWKRGGGERGRGERGRGGENGTKRDDDDVDGEKEDEEEEEEEEEIVHGVAYHIPSHQAQAVKEYLDVREVNGYSIQYTRFYRQDTATEGTAEKKPAHEGEENVIDNVMVYIGLPSNPQFLGVQSIEEVARVIATSRGPSGWNDEYLFMLEAGLEMLLDKAAAGQGQEQQGGRQGSGAGGKKGKGKRKERVVDGHVRALSRRVRELVGVERWESVVVGKRKGDSNGVGGGRAGAGADVGAAAAADEEVEK